MQKSDTIDEINERISKNESQRIEKLKDKLNVYQMISAITLEMSKEGISKSRKNQMQGYQFRGIDDVYSALSEKLGRIGLCILPRVTARDVVERQTKNGGALFYTVLNVDYDFVSAQDGSKCVIQVVGEAMDSGDKSTNKALSAAYKYACLQAFCIPTEGSPDADSETHEVLAKGERGPSFSKTQQQRAAPGSMSRAIKPPEPGPEFVDDQGVVTTLESPAEQSLVFASEDKLRELEEWIASKNISENTQKAWLYKAGVNKLSDLDADKVQKLIDSLKDKK